jgi:Carboxypeptidase regulatory-like domain
MRFQLLMLIAVLAGGCGSSPTTPSSTPQAAPVARWGLSGVVTSSAGGPINGAVVTILDGPNANQTTSSNASGRYRFADLTPGGFSIRVTARGYSDVTMGITLTTNQVVDVRLLFPLARLQDIGGAPIRYERVAGGFDMFANAVNAGEGCASQVAGVLTIRHSQQPNLTLDFSWTLPVDRIIQPHEQFEYRIGVITDAQAFQFPEGTASTRFSAASIPCP